MTESLLRECRAFIDGFGDPNELRCKIDAALSAESEAQTKWCEYCKTDTHNDAECHSTRPAAWKAGNHSAIVNGDGSFTISGATVAAPTQPPALTCVWSQDGEESDNFDTSCRNRFTLNEGGPSENGMKFCCYCGKPVEEHLHQEEADNE